jgi:hypothetical protein
MKKHIDKQVPMESATYGTAHPSPKEYEAMRQYWVCSHPDYIRSGEAGIVRPPHFVEDPATFVKEWRSYWRIANAPKDRDRVRKRLEAEFDKANGRLRPRSDS